MSGTELRSDSRYRYVMYRSDDSALMPFASRDEKLDAAEAGRRFTASAYTDVWAKDPALVTRVRGFLRGNFHWHERLAKRGPALEVVQTLREMVRGGSVIVCAENHRRGAGVEAVAPVPSPAAPGTFHQQVMEYMGLSSAAAWDYIDRYNALVDEVEAAEAALALKTRATVEASTPLGDAQPFEFVADARPDESFDLAKTPNEGEPGTWYTNPGSGQMRMFGEDGQRVVDFDFDHDHGQGIPHAHNWAIDPLNGKLGRGPGLPFSLLP